MWRWCAKDSNFGPTCAARQYQFGLSALARPFPLKMSHCRSWRQMWPKWMCLPCVLSMQMTSGTSWFRQRADRICAVFATRGLERSEVRVLSECCMRCIRHNIGPCSSFGAEKKKISLSCACRLGLKLTICCGAAKLGETLRKSRETVAKPRETSGETSAKPSKPRKETRHGRGYFAPS